MSLPEWGLNQANDKMRADNPFYIRKMNGFFRDHAGSGPGQVLYEIYYDIDTYAGSSIWPNGGKNPKGAEVYKSLRWGR